MKDSRRIWLRTHNGSPEGFTWALYRDPFDFDPDDDRIPERRGPNVVSWACALTEDEAADPAWDATPTEWRRVPRLLYPGTLEHVGARVQGREIVAAGCRFGIDQRGRARGPRQSPDAPEAVIDDEAELERVIAGLGRQVEVNGRIRGPRQGD